MAQVTMREFFPKIIHQRRYRHSGLVTWPRLNITEVIQEEPVLYNRYKLINEMVMKVRRRLFICKIQMKNQLEIRIHKVSYLLE